MADDRHRHGMRDGKRTTKGNIAIAARPRNKPTGLVKSSLAWLGSCQSTSSSFTCSSFCRQKIGGLWTVGAEDRWMRIPHICRTCTCAVARCVFIFASGEPDWTGVGKRTGSVFSQLVGLEHSAVRGILGDSRFRSTPTGTHTPNASLHPSG